MRIYQESVQIVARKCILSDGIMMCVYSSVVSVVEYWEIKMLMKIHKSNEPFDMSASHEFEPSKELSQEARKIAQTMSIPDEPELTEKMQKCKHNRLWRFSVGMPSNIVGCCDCDYWRFI